MCCPHSETYKDESKYNECCILLNIMLSFRMKVHNEYGKMRKCNEITKITEMVSILHTHVEKNGKMYCSFMNQNFYCACFQSIGLQQVKALEPGCILLCANITSQAKSYCKTLNIWINFFSKRNY